MMGFVEDALFGFGFAFLVLSWGVSIIFCGFLETVGCCGDLWGCFTERLLLVLIWI